MSSVWVGTRGTIRDYPGFNASRDAEAVRKAIRGIGTDEKTLIDILTGRSNAQRQLIAREYRAASGKDLKDDLKGDLSGNLERVMVALVMPPALFDAKQLKKSMKGAGTDEKALTEILASRTSKQMKEVAQAYYTAQPVRISYDEIFTVSPGWSVNSGAGYLIHRIRTRQPPPWIVSVVVPVFEKGRWNMSEERSPS